MRIRKALIVVVAVALICACFLAGREVGKKGAANPPGGPGATSSYSLEDLYNRLVSGADGTQDTFKEPTVAAGTPTMYALDQIMDKAPEQDNTTGARAADVAAGKEFWGLNVTAGEWGKRTGTNQTCVECTGTLSAGGRWCDQGNGTVLDMTTGLVWLKNANYLGGTMDWDDAIMRPLTEIRHNGTNLTDGSVWGDWRLPTKDELDGITEGDEYILSSRPGPFDNVQSYLYWSSTTHATDTIFAWLVSMDDGHVATSLKGTNIFYVWPVRGP